MSSSVFTGNGVKHQKYVRKIYVKRLSLLEEKGLLALPGDVEGAVTASDTSGTRWCRWTEQVQRAGSAGPEWLSAS